MIKAPNLVKCEEASAHILKSIMRKRANEKLSFNDINKLVQDFVIGRIPDYQMSAWLATVASIGMDIDEIEALTRAYVSDGVRINYNNINGKIVDKHSTGGVGDKVTFVVVPIVAACGIPVVKISGRGLGHAGGTLDKLEALKGLKVDLNSREVCNILNKVGMVMTGQSGDLVPGDKATYQLRDVSGAVESIPLIAASIISKKIATGADCLVLDVKTGPGALIQDYNKSIELAEIMVELAKRFNIACRAIISDMSQPLGYAIGHTLEIKEALSVLKGEKIPGLTDLCCVIARLMLQVANPYLNDNEADEQVYRSIQEGHAYKKLIEWANEQGADEKQLLNPEFLPNANNSKIIYANQSGWINSIDPRNIGNAAVHLSTCSQQHSRSLIDYTAGIVLHKQVGDKVSVGQALAEIHYNEESPILIEEMILSSFEISDSCAQIKPIVHKIIGL